jgi:hypothetical protein
MTDFNINTFTTTAQSLVSGEFGFVGQSGLISTDGTAAVTAIDNFSITVLGALATVGAPAISSNDGFDVRIATGLNGAIMSNFAAIDIVAGSTLRVVNAGLISGQNGAVRFVAETSGGIQLQNTGEINASISSTIFA